ncbi:hypothetical protein ACPV4I_20365 [Photobacterium damselae]
MPHLLLKNKADEAQRLLLEIYLDVAKLETLDKLKCEKDGVADEKI